MTWLCTVASRLSHPSGLWQFLVWVVGIRAGASLKGARARLTREERRP